MRRILITGSSGLIGQVLCKKIDKFYCIEKFDSKFHKESSEYGDILLPKTLQQRLKHCDGIIHLAAISRVIWGEKQPDICWKTNVTGTCNILDLAYQSPKKPWVLYASSREVYGQQQLFPVKESARLKPLNIYANSKVAAEGLVEKYKLKGLKTAILRFSSVYGSINDHHDRVVPAFCQAAVTGKPIHIEGATNMFDFTHVTDVVEAIFKVIKRLEQGQELPTMHLTSGQAVSLETLAKLVTGFAEYPLKLIIDPPRCFDVSKFYGDNSLTCRLLNWAPKINIETGISMLMNDFYQKN
ncbi:MAG: NAD-dependent epimerase/dehydratase family protein [Arsenophonus sp. NEOnobi-MAG3]